MKNLWIKVSIQRKKTDSNGKKAYNKKVDSRYPNKDILNILKIFSWNIVTFWGTGS